MWRIFIVIFLNGISFASAENIDNAINDIRSVRDVCDRVACSAHFISQSSCVALTDGCQIVGRPYMNPGRYLQLDKIIPIEGVYVPTFAILSLEIPMTWDYLKKVVPVSTCARRHEFVCIDGSPPSAPPNGPTPTGVDWIGESELNRAWIRLTDKMRWLRCLSMQTSFVMSVDGHLPSISRRRVWPECHG